MKSGNKVEVQQDGWRIEKLTQWPVSATYHHCGWCTAENKSEFDDYIGRGDLWVLFRPSDRRNRPSCQMFVSHEGFSEIMSKGNRNISMIELESKAPPAIALWLSSKRMWIEEKTKSHSPSLFDGFGDGMDIIPNHGGIAEFIPPCAHIGPVSTDRIGTVLEAVLFNTEQSQHFIVSWNHKSTEPTGAEPLSHHFGDIKEVEWSRLGDRIKTGSQIMIRKAKSKNGSVCLDGFVSSDSLSWNDDGSFNREFELTLNVAKRI